MRSRLLLLSFGLMACAHAPSVNTEAVSPSSTRGSDASYSEALLAWKRKRLSSIAGEDGWITLVARAWLRPGDNRFGSDAKNELVLPVDRAPALAGTITLVAGTLRVKIAPGVTVLSAGQPMNEQVIADDRDQQPTLMTLGSLTMHVIKRQDRYALRVKDREHPARKTFGGLHYYPTDPSLRVRAKLSPSAAGKTLPIVNILGQTEAMPMAGTLQFSLGGVAYTLDAVREAGDDELFILFKDETAGHGTYPSGRFLYTPLPTAEGTVELDFNRAFNPPCAFTAFATCPIPPAQNRIGRRIEAGEKYEGSH